MRSRGGPSTLLRLYADQVLARCITAEARRHFGRDEDREDACSEAWLSIVASSNGTAAEVLARRAIHNLYKRERRRRRWIRDYAEGLRPWLENNC